MVSRMRAYPLLVATFSALAVACGGQALPGLRADTPEKAPPTPLSAAPGVEPKSTLRAVVAPASTACAALATAKPEPAKVSEWRVLSPPSTTPGPVRARADLEDGTFRVSPDGRYGVALTAGERKLRVFDLGTGAELPWSGRLSQVRGVQLSNTRALVASTTTNDAYDVALVDLATGKIERQSSTQSSPTLEISGAGNVYAIGDSQAITVYASPDGRVLRKVGMPNGRVYLSSDGAAVVVPTGGSSSACFVDVRRLDGAADRRVRIADSCPNQLAVGARGERLAWVDVDRKSRELPWNVYVLDKAGAPRRGPRLGLSGWHQVVLDASEQWVAAVTSAHVEIGRLSDPVLSIRPAVAAGSVSLGADGTFVEASQEAFVRHDAMTSLEVVGRAPAKPRVATDDGTFVAIGVTSVRWYTREGALLGGVLRDTKFRAAQVAGADLTVLTDRGELTVARTATGLALKQLVPMRSGCTYDHGCVRVAPGVVANLDISNGDNPKVGLAGPFPLDGEPARIECPSRRGRVGVATDGTFVSVAASEMVVRNVCSSEPWRTVPFVGPRPYEIRACPGFVIAQADNQARFDVIAIADGKKLTTITSETKAEIPSCEAVRERLESAPSSAAR